MRPCNVTRSLSENSVVGPPEREQFFRLAKTAKQAMLVVSSMQLGAARRKKGRSEPDRILRLASKNRKVAKGPAQEGGVADCQDHGVETETSNATRRWLASIMDAS